METVATAHPTNMPPIWSPLGVIDNTPDTYELDDDWTETELSDMEKADLARYRAMMINDAQSDVDASNAEFKAELIARGIDPADHVRDHAYNCDDMQREARRHGWNADTLEEGRALRQGKIRANSDRAESRERHRINIGAARPEPKAAPEPQTPENFPPLTTDRAALILWAREYCHHLTTKYPGIERKIYGAPGAGQGALAWQLAQMPLNDSELLTWAKGAFLSFTKKASK